MPTQDELEDENELDRARQQVLREERTQEREIRRERQDALNRATSTEQRREIKQEAERRILEARGFSSSGGDEKGGIYDLSTDTYSQPKRNQVDQDVSTAQDGIDKLGGSSNSDTDSGDSNVEFNGSVIICIDGSPFYIDIAFDSTAGVYQISDGANYPITAP